MKRFSAPVLVVLLLFGACGSAGATVVASGGGGSCSSIDAFEEAIRNIGIVYNYQPSKSPQDLAQMSDAVVTGTLTGVGEGPRIGVGPGTKRAVFTIDVDRVIARSAGPEIGETLAMGVQFNPAARSIADFEKAFPDGAMTVVFLSEYQGDWTPYLEGFWFACDENDEPGNGIVEPGWSVDSLDDLIVEVSNTPSVKPEPSPTTDEFDSEQLEDGRIRIWPRSQDVADEGTYRFTVPHCGLDWMVDFDGSFWSAEHPEDYGEGNRYPFFYDSDAGTFTFVSPDEAIYEASTGERIPLRRIDGPIVIHPCD